MTSIPDFASLGTPLTVVLHDAGAANLLIGWLQSSANRPDLQACVAGPGLVLWQRAFPSIPTQPLENALKGAAALISGTGWASELEHQSRAIASRTGIPMYAVVDHWVNYRQRFIRNGTQVLPDEVWVGDNYAINQMALQLPEVRARQFTNIYFENQVESVVRLNASRAKNGVCTILYALEPIRQQWEGTDLRLGEFQALDYFLSRLDDLGVGEQFELRLRPHPSDPAGKYDEWIAEKSDPRIFLADDEPIDLAIARADIVAGCESYVLVIALGAKKRVISTTPPWAPSIRLPHLGIVRLCKI